MTLSSILRIGTLTIALASALCACSGVEVDPSGPAPDELEGAGYVYLGVARQVPAPPDLTRTVAPSAEAEAPSGEANAPRSVLVLADGSMYEQPAPPPDQLERLAALLEEMNSHEQNRKPEARTRGGEGDGKESPTGQRILGTDGRSRVAASSLDDLPFRAIGRIGSGCSGALIGPRHVLTAAHCLHDDNGDWYWPLVFRPGVDGNTDINGPARTAVARRAYVGYTSNRGLDIGLLVLEDEASTASLGRFGFWYYDDPDTYVGRTVYNYGYPLNANTCGSGTCDGGMWGMSSTIPSASAQQLQHRCDTQGGHSGSPVYEIVDGSRRILGVHWGPGGGPVAATETNSAARIRSGVAADLCEWMSWWPGTHGGMPSCAL